MLKIHPSAVVAPNAELGDVVVSEGAVVGAEGLNLDRIDDQLKPKGVTGSVVLKDGVFIGANAVVQRGLTQDTVIGENTYIGPLCNIGHDVIIGKHCIITGNTLICGYAELGDNVRVSPHSTIENRVKIGDGAWIGTASLVRKDVPAGVTVYGHPAK